jgi:hypothetical protein
MEASVTHLQRRGLSFAIAIQEIGFGNMRLEI